MLTTILPGRASAYSLAGNERSSGETTGGQPSGQYFCLPEFAVKHILDFFQTKKEICQKRGIYIIGRFVVCDYFEQP